MDKTQRQWMENLFEALFYLILHNQGVEGSVIGKNVWKQKVLENLHVKTGRWP